MICCSNNTTGYHLLCDETMHPLRFMKKCNHSRCCYGRRSRWGKGAVAPPKLYIDGGPRPPPNILGSIGSAYIAYAQTEPCVVRTVAHLSCNKAATASAKHSEPSVIFLLLRPLTWQPRCGETCGNYRAACARVCVVLRTQLCSSVQAILWHMHKGFRWVIFDFLWLYNHHKLYKQA